MLAYSISALCATSMKFFTVFFCLYTVILKSFMENIHFLLRSHFLCTYKTTAVPFSNGETLFCTSFNGNLEQAQSLCMYVSIYG